jgi:hypothetical protein
MTEKLNTVLLLLLLALVCTCAIRRRPSEVGRFQQVDSPAHQIAFDTKTGQRCWVWIDLPTNIPPPPNGAVVDNKDGFQLCSELAKQ